MKRNRKIAIVIVLLVLITAFFTYHYVFTIYEVSPGVEPAALYADGISETVIRLIPVNSLGWGIPLRNASAEFEIREGKELVEIIEINRDEGTLRLRAKDKPGKVSLLIRSKFSLLPLLVEIEVLQNLT